METSEELIAAAYKENYASLRRYLLSMSLEPEVASDIIQDTFAKLSKLSHDKMPPNIVPWLFVVCKNTALKHIKKNKKFVSLVDTDMKEECDDSPLQAICDREGSAQDLKDLQKAIDRLGVNSKKAIKLRYYSGLSYVEIAKKLNTTLGSASATLHQAIKRLRKYLLEIYNERKQIDNRHELTRRKKAGTGDSIQSSKQG
jgi:RNA polymerase sigma factor (sigma-70 family)